MGGKYSGEWWDKVRGIPQQKVGPSAIDISKRVGPGEVKLETNSPPDAPPLSPSSRPALPDS
jgi:hypothetical protein